MAMSAEEFNRRQQLAAQYGAPPVRATQTARRFATASAPGPVNSTPKPPPDNTPPTPSFIDDLSRESGRVLNTIATGGDGFQVADLIQAIPRAVGVSARGLTDLAVRTGSAAGEGVGALYDVVKTGLVGGLTGKPVPPATPKPSAPAPDPAAAPAPDPAAVPQKTPEQVFADLQQQRGFSPLGGVDPNATHSPTLFQRTDALRTRPGSANPNDVQALQDYRQAGFDTAQQEVIAAQDALLLNPKDPKAQQRLAQAEAGFAESRQALMAAQGPLERRQYAVPGGSASGVTSVNTSRGGFMGAATDVAAARNLQARFEQDAAASQIAAGYDRETERLRDARAEKMGISRAKLDASEGRSNPLTSLFAPQQQQAAPEAFSQPGDGFGDATMRRLALESQMADTHATGAERRAAAEVYKGYLSPAHGTGAGGPANGHSPDLFSMVDKMRDNQRADQNLALQNQQFQETRRANAFNQALNATKEDRAAREQFRVQGKDAQGEIVKAADRYIARHSDKKTGRGPDLGPIRTFGTQLARTDSLRKFDPKMVQRLQDNALTESDWEMVGQMRQMFENSKPGLSTLYLGSPMSADEIVQRYFQTNSPNL